MSYFHWIVGWFLGLSWFSRLVAAAFGMRKLADLTEAQWAIAKAAPKVSIIVPARNEEDHIEQTLVQLLALDYPDYEVIAVNDRSTDRTGEVMDRVSAMASAQGRLTVLHIDALPGGWMGKAHAMWTAANSATGAWLLFTDADVLFKKDSLRRAVAYAEVERADHFILFPRMVMKAAGERMMIAFFQTLFVFGHRPWRVSDPKAKDHMGVGAFNMVRRTVYESIGTYRALRMEVLDDMKLGKVVKNAGFRQRNAFGDDLISIRWAHGAMGVVNNLTKNFFAIVSFQWWRAVGSFIALGFLNLGPFLGVWLAPGWAKSGYALALASMFLIYLGMSWNSSIPPYYFMLHPISTALFMYTLARSMALTLGNGGVEWRGTFYPLEELKKGMV
jgi:glycosyltransferase involved in cell wall biosynthesis